MDPFEEPENSDEEGEDRRESESKRSEVASAVSGRDQRQVCA